MHHATGGRNMHVPAVVGLLADGASVPGEWFSHCSVQDCADVLSKLPPSSLEAISSLTEGRHGTTRLPNPLCLRLACRASGRSRPCGVLEFTAPEGRVVVPAWLLRRLHSRHPLLIPRCKWTLCSVYSLSRNLGARLKNLKGFSDSVIRVSFL